MDRVVKIFSFVNLCIVLVVLAYLNFSTPLIGEDFALSLPLNEVKNLTLLFAKIFNQYTTWNSRLGELLAIIFLYFDKNIFNFINILMFFYFCWLITYFATGEKRLNINLVAIVSIVLILVMPVFGEIFIWLTGASNYLFAFCLLASFLVPWRKTWQDYNQVSIPILFLYIILSILAGMTNENTVPAILVLCTLLLTLFVIKNRKLCRLRVIGLFFLLAGYLLLVFSPSTNIRIETFRSIYGKTEPSFALYLGRLSNIFSSLFCSSNYLLSIIFVSVIFTLLVCIKQRKVLFNFVFLLFTTSLISLIILIFSPYLEVRSFLLFWFSGLVLFVFALFQLKEIHYGKCVFVCILVSTSVLFYSQLPSYASLYRSFNEEARLRDRRIKTLALKPVRGLIKVSRFQTSSNRMLNTREDYLFRNKLYAEYYNVKQIEISDVKIIDREFALSLLVDSNKDSSNFRFGDNFLLKRILINDYRIFFGFCEKRSIKLVWESLNSVQLKYRVAIHFLDSEKKIISQADFDQSEQLVKLDVHTFWENNIDLSSISRNVCYIGLALFSEKDMKCLSISRGLRDWGNTRLLIPIAN